ncbi:hypothetical protein EDC04DRAFT_2712362 [Pisolithus marmoratus]|nr:hypothetical protein EDC04DRAFT_2712362 [Pisolithus marmoratus]
MASPLCTIAIWTTIPIALIPVSMVLHAFIPTTARLSPSIVAPVVSVQRTWEQPQIALPVFISLIVNCVLFGMLCARHFLAANRITLARFLLA